jgi:hypothetical protein
MFNSLGSPLSTLLKNKIGMIYTMKICNALFILMAIISTSACGGGGDGSSSSPSPTVSSTPVVVS